MFYYLQFAPSCYALLHEGMFYAEVIRVHPCDNLVNLIPYVFQGRYLNRQYADYR
jgi:hypothetical protein